MNAKRWLAVVAGCLVLVGAGTLVFTNFGCGPRAQVAKDKVMDQIDQLLGKTEVQRKEAQKGVDDMKKAVDKLREGKISAKVRADQLGDQLNGIDEKIAKDKSALAILQDDIKSGQPKEIGGTKYDTKGLTDLANTVIDHEKKLETQREGVKRAKDVLDTAVTTLTTRQKDAEDHVATLESKLQEIDAEMLSLKSLKDAAAVMGDTDTTLTDRYADAQKKVNELEVSVKTQLGVDQEKWNAATASQAVTDANKIVADVKGPQDTLSEIDKILNKK